MSLPVVKAADSGVAAACRIEIVADRARFDALEGPWNDLFARSGRATHVFQGFNFLWHWADHYLGGDTALSIVTGWRGDRLVMAWPLVVRRLAGIREVSWMGAPVGQYGDVLVEQGHDTCDWLRQGWTEVKRLKVDVIHLRKTRRDAVVAPLLAEMQPTASSAAPYLDLARTKCFLEYEKAYDGKVRSSRRRFRRRLSEIGEIRFEQHEQGPVARDLAGRALELKRASLRQRGVLATAIEDPRFERFFRAAASDGPRWPGLRLSVVRCDGEPIAVEISFVCKGQVFGHVLAYDGAFGKQGLGVVLADYSIRTAHQQGYARFDLLAPSDAYKMDWADACAPVDDWALALSPVGSIFVRAWLCGARRWLKDAANNLPSGLGHMMSRMQMLRRA